MKQKPQEEKENDLMNQQKISPELLQSLQQLYERQDETETEKPSAENWYSSFNKFKRFTSWTHI